jgi:hypothetical protein
VKDPDFLDCDSKPSIFNKWDMDGVWWSEKQNIQDFNKISKSMGKELLQKVTKLIQDKINAAKKRSVKLMLTEKLVRITAEFGDGKSCPNFSRPSDFGSVKQSYGESIKEFEMALYEKRKDPGLERFLKGWMDGIRKIYFGRSNMREIHENMRLGITRFQIAHRIDDKSPLSMKSCDNLEKEPSLKSAEQLFIRNASDHKDFQFSRFSMESDAPKLRELHVSYTTLD